MLFLVQCNHVFHCLPPALPRHQLQAWSRRIGSHRCPALSQLSQLPPSPESGGVEQRRWSGAVDLCRNVRTTSGTLTSRSWGVASTRATWASWVPPSPGFRPTPGCRAVRVRHGTRFLGGCDAALCKGATSPLGTKNLTQHNTLRCHRPSREEVRLLFAVVARSPRRWPI